MREILTYVTGVLVCSGLFVLFYRTALYRRTSFPAARGFLIVSLAFAAIIPALDIPVWRVAPVEIFLPAEAPAAQTAELPEAGPGAVSATMTGAGAVSEAVTGAVSGAGGEVATLSPAPSDWPAIVLWALWGVGIALLGVVMARQIARISRIRRRAEIYRTKEYRIAVSGEVYAPFSFLETVFVERGTPDHEMRQIVLHEASHIRHHHSQEKIAMEILKNLMWFNPFAWWAARLLGEVHEFEADRDVLEGGFTAEEYLPLIFRQIFGYIPELSVGLGDSLTKKRFLMIKNKMKLTKYSWLRVAGVLPLATGMMLLFSFTSRPPEIIVIQPDRMAAQVAETEMRVGQFETHAEQTRLRAGQAETEAEQTRQQAEDAAQAVIAVVTAIPQSPDLRSPDEPLLIAGKMPTFRGGDLNDFRAWAFSQVQYPKEASDNNVQGTVTAKFIVERNGRVSNVEILDSPAPSLSAAVVSVISSSPEWTPGMEGGKAVRVVHVVPINFRLEFPEETQAPPPLYFVDGREVTPRQVDNLDPDDIESIDVVQSETAMGLYGSRGVSGAVRIRTGSTGRAGESIDRGYGIVSELNNTTSVSTLDMKDAHYYSSLKEYMQGRVPGVYFIGDVLTIRGIGSINSVEALVVVDGVPMGSFSAANASISPSQVASISVMKDAGSAGIYGARGGNGVVVISTIKGPKTF
jgi:TonB family protein